MLISQKCQYAVRSVFELAKRRGEGPVRIADIATAQAIPQRFLEVILAQLKQAGLTESVRGKEGGYRLARPPKDITVGDVVRVSQGSLKPVDCLVGTHPCPMKETGCVFIAVWDKAEQSLAQSLDGTTYQMLLDIDAAKKAGEVLRYEI